MPSWIGRLRLPRRSQPAPVLPRVAVVTDSTSALDPEQAAEWGITVVPLDVAAGQERFRDGVDLGPAELIDLLDHGTRVTTSQPAPAVFAEAYQRLADEGAQEVVSVHLSGALSGTVRAAGLAAQLAPLPVHVVDSLSAGLGLGFAARAAARTEGDGSRVAAEAERVGRSTSAWFVVDSLDHLRRGGRISGPAAALGTVLGLRPVLALREGRIDVVERVRTRPAARDRLVQLVREESARRDGPVRIAVHHLGRAEVAESLAERLHEVDGAAEIRVAELGAVLGGHLGPGALAVVVVDD
ncbi:DegV family protein [Cellulomonas sp. NPDC089187]|uniref:DegV family protein n=1 Tax=Cellulomonas sp. NPDC089187 TaxID=3154970 RepID=UPI0034393354